MMFPAHPLLENETPVTSQSRVCISHLPKEVLSYLLSLSSWETVIANRCVSKAWLAAAEEVRQTFFIARQCWKAATHLSWCAFWWYLFTAEKVIHHDVTLVNDYFCELRIGENDIHMLEANYRAEENYLFHPDFLIVEKIIRPYRTGILFDTNKQQLEQKAQRHIQALIAKWREQLQPGQLLSTLNALLQTAMTLKTEFPDLVGWLLSTKENYKLPSHFEFKRLEGCQKLLNFLEQTAFFEEVLLEFAIFCRMISNQSALWKRIEDNLFILKNDFSLLKRLSAAFYRQYIGYLGCVQGEKENHKTVLINRELFNYLCRNNDEFMLELFGWVWSDLPEILLRNPDIYKLMRPELWIDLCKANGNYAFVIFRDPIIYKKFTSAQLFEFFKEHSGRFEKILYGKSILEIPDECIPLDLLPQENIQASQRILECLESTYLFALRKKSFISKRSKPAAILVHRVLCKRLEMFSQQGFAQLNGLYDLKELGYYFEEYANDEGSVHGLEIVNLEIRRRREMLNSKLLIENEKGLQELEKEERKEVSQQYSQQNQQSTEELAILRRRFQRGLERSHQEVFDFIIHHPDWPDAADVLKSQRSRTTAQSGQTEMSLLQHLMNKWKAIPLGWKIIGGLFLFGSISVIVAGIFFPPSLVLTLPILEKTVSIGTLMIGSGAALAGITSVSHLFHIAMTSMPVSLKEISTSDDQTFLPKPIKSTAKQIEAVGIYQSRYINNLESMNNSIPENLIKS